MSAQSPRFHTLSVQDVRRETPDAVSVAFAVPPELRDAFAFEPGQYLTLRASIDGTSIRRSYSISSGPNDGELRVAVKLVEGGAFSTWVNSALRDGHAIDVMTPTGRFGVGAPREAGAVRVGFAAGSGITPIISIMRGALTREPSSRFFLFYGNRSTQDVLFKSALEELKDRFMGRLSICHVLSREQQDVPVLNGHLDGDKVRVLLRAIVPAATVSDVFICGPETMIDDLETACRDLGIPDDRIHAERFVSAFDGKPRARPAPVIQAKPKHVASLIVDGKRRDVPVLENESLLDAALRAGMDLPYACKGGMCSTCRAKVEEGAVTMDVNYSLEPWELEKGFVLTCQAHPTTPRVVVDFDQV